MESELVFTFLEKKEIILIIGITSEIRINKKLLYFIELE